MNPLAADGLPPLRDVVRSYGLEPKKSLGQNFLFDLNLTNRIARAAGPLEGVSVFEVGPGPGGLTRALLSQGAQVMAVEQDARCIAALDEIGRHYPDRLRIVRGDALEIDPGELGFGDTPFRIVANLPYNVGTALLTRWIEAPVWPPRWDRLVLMFQREVAERIVATPRERAAYGRLAVLCGWRTRARILFDVSPSAFTPPPKVTSSVVELVPRADPMTCSVPILSGLTQATFGQRRKMLRQSLRTLPLLNGRSVEPAVLLQSAGIEPTRRPEEIDVAGFVALAQAWTALTRDIVDPLETADRV